MIGGNKMTTYTFGTALEAVKQGRKAKRVNWNGKDQYIELATCISYKKPDGEIINPEHVSMGNQAIVFVGTQGIQIGWLASQSDMLSDDWIIF